MSNLALHEPEFLLQCLAIEDPTLQVYRFRGREAMGQPSEFTVELTSQQAALDLESPIGTPVRLQLRGRTPAGSRYSRYVHGVVVRMAQLSAGARYSRYELVLVSQLGTLAFSRDCRIFSNLSTPQILAQVLEEQGIPKERVSLLLHSHYKRRSYCVQYQESPLQFLTRLMEKDGLCYFLEQTPDSESCHISDGAQAFVRLQKYESVSMRDLPHLYEEGLFELRAEQALRPGTVVLKDYRFQQPAVEMDASAQRKGGAAPELFLFPGEYVAPELGRRLAALRLEEQEAQRLRFTGRSNVRELAPGHLFVLTGHRRASWNQEYLIISVEHDGIQPQALPAEAAEGLRPTYENRVVCQPAATPFRLPCVTPRPKIPGVQTATVIGPSAEEVHCDEYGRVKVAFHWQRQAPRRSTHQQPKAPGRQEACSCWIRVSQPWSGAYHGVQFIPRVGHEVVVQFLEGDPDRPLIVGSVANGDHPPPYTLPEHKSISTIRTSSTPGGVGFNEIKFDDQRDAELLGVHAQRDLAEVVKRNHTTTVGNDQETTVLGQQRQQVTKNQSLTVLDGDQETVVCKGHSLLSVKQDRKVVVQSGSHQVEVCSGDSNHIVRSGHHTVEVDTGHSTLLVKTGNHTTEVQSGHHTVQVQAGNSGVWVKTGSHAISARKSLTLASVAADLSLSAATLCSASAGQALSLAAPEISLVATRRIMLGVGKSSIIVDETGITISGPQLSSHAVGTQTLTGALIKLN